MATVRVLCGRFVAAATVTALAHAALAQPPDVAPIATIDSAATYIRTAGTRLYVIAEKTLHIFDITNASAPKRLGGYTFPENVEAVTVSGSMVYVSADFNLLRIIDTKDAAAPVERGSLPIRGGIQTLAMSEPDLVLMTTSLEGLEVVDVSNPSASVRVSSNLFTDSYAQDVVAAGRLVLASDSSTGVYLFDLTMPKSIEVLGMLPFVYQRLSKDVPPAWISPELAIVPPSGSSPATTAVVLDDVTGRVEVVDVKDPRKPVRVGSIELSSRAQGLVIDGSRVFVGARQGVRVIDISKPASPKIVGTFKTAQPSRDLAVEGGHIFVALGSDGVEIFRNPSY
jgi:hypothetical protein